MTDEQFEKLKETEITAYMKEQDEAGELNSRHMDTLDCAFAKGFDKSRSLYEATLLAIKVEREFEAISNTKTIMSGTWAIEEIKRLEARLTEEREKNARLVELLKSLNVQAIINGQPGHQSVSDRIKSALAATEGDGTDGKI